MPFVKTGSKLIYYAHIPKCAGSSVEHYLKARFGPIALLDSKHSRILELNRWSKTSPQHMDYAAVERLMPRKMFDAAFAVVRHPVKRLISVFKFQRDVERVIAPDTDFSTWLRWIADNKNDLRFRHDNHLLPQTAFLPPDCTLFYLEHGLEQLVGYFDEITGKKDGPAEFEWVNESTSNAKHHLSSKQPPVTPTVNDLNQIYDIYETDFKDLGYNLNDPTPLRDKAHTLSTTSPYRRPPVSAPRRILIRVLRKLLGIIEHPELR